MAIHHYTRQIPDNGKNILEYRQTIRLSGSDGLIAKWIRSQPDSDCSEWTLTSDTITTLLGLPEVPSSLVFSCRNNDDLRRQFFLVRSIHGRTSLMETDIVLSLQPIPNSRSSEDEGSHPRTLSFSPFSSSDSFFETFRIKGGNSRLRHSWKLSPPRMAIGGVIRQSGG